MTRSSIRAILTKVIAHRKLFVDVDKAVTRTLELMQANQPAYPAQEVDAMAQAIKEQL